MVMMDYVNIAFAMAGLGAAAECIVILLDYVITSVLSQMGRG